MPSLSLSPHARSKVLAAVLLCLTVPFAGFASSQWITKGVLNVPSYQYSFLAATPDGDLLAATFNGTNEPAQAPMLLIKDPTGVNPQVEVITSVLFDGQRGYSGVACMPDGSFFVAGDTGDEGTSFIKKFRKNGTLDTSFGNNGEVRPGRRALGVDVMGEYLLVALNWGKVGVIRANDGAILGGLPDPEAGFFLRDISIDPGTLDIFGVAEGDVYLWEGGSPWNPTSYRRRMLSQSEGSLRSGEGISIDPLSKSALTTPIPGNVLASVSPDGVITRSTVNTAQEDSELTDSSLSFDGRTLFVSDLKKRRIHVMEREGAGAAGNELRQIAQAPRSAAAAEAPQTTYKTQTKWYRSYLGIVEAARRYNKPMLVYFRSGTFPECLEFERSTLLTPQFDAAVQNRVVCVFEDVSKDPLIAYRLGVFRVPHVTVFNSAGDPVARFTREISTPELIGAIQSVN
ncbi:MAG: thioredoxin family protein [Sumerlaeia bacterium]